MERSRISSLSFDAEEDMDAPREPSGRSPIISPGKGDAPGFGRRGEDKGAAAKAAGGV
jgi:hypothetical protein